MEKVLFDPGYSSCILGVSDSVEFMYGAFQDAMMPLKQKKFQFSLIYPKLQLMLKKNIAFYLGCLLWAVYIKSIKNTEIEDNPCLNEVYNEEESTEEPLFLLHFTVEQLNRDAKYYLNKTYSAPIEFEKILENYIEFLKLNKGFCETKTTEDIILPKNIKSQTKESLLKIKEAIDNAIQSKELEKLYEIYDLIL